MKGRVVRCSRCQHQWDQPFVATQPEARPKRPEARLVVDEPRPRAPEPVMASAVERPEPEPIGDNLLAAAMRDEERGDSGGNDAAPGPNPFDRIAEMMMEQPPVPVPDLFASAAGEPARRRRGAFALVAVAVVIILAIIAGLAFVLQDRIINRYPALARYYDELGARHTVPGAGLSFRDVSADRPRQDNAEVLVVRGVIVNATDRELPIPPLRLVLYDGPNVVQEKTIEPPQSKLDAKGTAGFKVTLDQPDPHATRFEITFGEAKSGAAAQAKSQ